MQQSRLPSPWRGLCAADTRYPGPNRKEEENFMDQSPVLIAVPEHPVKSISWKTNESPRACPQRQSLDAVTRHHDSDLQRQYPIAVHSDSLTALSAATAPQRCQRDIKIMIRRNNLASPSSATCLNAARSDTLQRSLRQSLSAVRSYSVSAPKLRARAAWMQTRPPVRGVVPKLRARASQMGPKLRARAISVGMVREERSVWPARDPSQSHDVY
jgi:hypothetical protein